MPVPSIRRVDFFTPDLDLAVRVRAACAMLRTGLPDLGEDVMEETFEYVDTCYHLLAVPEHKVFAALAQYRKDAPYEIRDAASGEFLARHAGRDVPDALSRWEADG